MRAWNLRVACLALALCAMGAAFPSPRELPLGGPTVEQPMAGGESHSYALTPNPGARLLVTADQRGIDVALELRRADGSLLVAVDGPTDRDGPESLLIPAGLSGPLEIRVKSGGQGVAPGSYGIRLEAVQGPRIEAEQLMTEAAAGNLEGTAESLKRAAGRYEEARDRWHGLGDRSQEARCARSAAEVHASLGEPGPALALFRQALALSTDLHDEAGQAVAWSGLGLAQTALGDRDAALDALRRALDLEKTLGRRHQEGKVLNNLGLTLHARGDLREALAYYQQALDAFHRAGEKGAWEAAVLQNLALVNTGLGEPEAALRSHQQVLALRRELGDEKGEAQTLNNLGVLYNNLGRPGEALEVYAPALAIFRRTGDRSWEAALLHNAGVAYYGLGDDPRAVAHLEQALAIRREAGDRRGEAMTEVSLGHARLRSGEPAPAREAGRRAAELAAALPDRRVEMLARLLLGEAGVAAGDPQTALSELSRARELAKALEDRLGEARGLQITGQAYLTRKQAEEAIRVLTEAVALSRAIQRPGRIVASLTDLARAERMAGRPAEALVHLDEALHLIETLRATESDPDLRASYLASTHAAFELAVDLRMDLDRREPGKGHAREALEVSERARARSLLDLLQEAEADVREGIDPALRSRERALLLRLEAKAARQADLLKRPASEERRRAAEGEVRSVLEELDQVDAEIRRGSPRYAALTRPSPANVAEIQGLLDGKTLLLEYSLGEERSFLWAVGRGSVAAFELPPRARIEAAVRDLYGRLSVLSPNDGRLDVTALKLSRMLLGPLSGRLGRLGERRLVVVADGELHTLPFGMLPDPASPGAPLLARHEIVNAPSASAIALQRRLARRPAPPGAVAVLADPVFDPGDPRVPAGLAGKIALRSAASDAGPLLRLPWTRREAQAIAAVAPPGRSFLALDFKASRETALSPELARYRIVHFATHGLIDPRTPALSGLMLSRVSERGAPREGFLGLRDVYNLRLGADLVVLSGCETALGRKLRGEGLVGLTQGFLYAGARQVAASLWRVEDQATAELMSRFYHYLLVEGRPPAAALRLAQLAVREDKRWRSPYYWSGFVLQGDWRKEAGR